jgi:hypothetical protein
MNQPISTSGLYFKPANATVNVRTQRFYEMKKLGFCVEQGLQTGVDKVVKDGDSDWQAFLASGQVKFHPAHLKTNVNETPKAKLDGNQPIPSRRIRILKTKALKRLNEQRLLTQGKDRFDVAERISNDLEGAVVMSGYRAVEYLPNAYIGQMRVKISNPELAFVADVKPMQRLILQDEDVQDDFAWIEHSGDPDLCDDQLYKYLQDETFEYIIFERQKYFLVVLRKLVAEYCLKHVQEWPPAETAKEAIKRIYVRGDKNDVQFLLPLKDLESHPFFKDQVMKWFKIVPEDFLE